MAEARFGVAFTAHQCPRTVLASELPVDFVSTVVRSQALLEIPSVAYVELPRRVLQDVPLIVGGGETCCAA
jgi:hypothetical protein